MAKELLLEIGTEELPAGYVSPALESLKAAAAAGFKEARIGFGEVRTFGTPRRLVLQVTDVAQRQEDLLQEQQGPAKKVAFDGDGRPTKAAKGFAQGKGVSVDDLMVKETPRGEYVFARVLTKGRPASEILSTLLPDLIRGLPFPKSMRWGRGELRFARPIHWLLALLGEQAISFALEDIQSGNQTYGHRQLSPGPFRVSSASDYWGVLARMGIVIDQDARRRSIWEALNEKAAAAGGRPLRDERLLDTVTYLVEMPTALCGHFDEGYLSLPREVLTTAMSEHQKYFAVVDEKDDLLPLFLAVSNGDPGHGELILSGNERVLAARLEDAKFFFEEDQRSSLADKVDMLKEVVFQEDLGTLYEKTERIQELTDHLTEALGLSEEQAEIARRAARLCKADLVTHMVGEKEFSRLQGYMGQQYALAAGEPEAVAQAVFEHYLPRFAEDDIPASLPGSVVAVADKMDTIAGCFAVGLIPTGSQDPYALRRGALGVVRILLHGGLAVDLGRLVDKAIDLLKGKLKRESVAVREEVSAFFRQRMEALLAEDGLEVDVVDAVLSADARDVVGALGRGRALQDFRAQRGFEQLVQGSKRVANILRGQEVTGEPVADLMGEETERVLFEAAEKVRKQIAERMRKSDYEGALGATLELVAPIDAFFDRILVMDKDLKVRENRLRLLAQIRGIFLALADYSKIVVRGETDS